MLRSNKKRRRVDKIMKISKDLKKFQIEMRKNPTRYEKIFSEILKKIKIDFKQQMILGFFILDFVIPNKMLVFEIDGNFHKLKKDYDKFRDNFIEGCGFNVIHIENKKVKNSDIFSILEKFEIKDIKYFRSALAKANSIKGVVLKKLKS